MKRISWIALPVLFISMYAYKMRAELANIAAVLTYSAVFSLLLASTCKKLEACGLRPNWAAACAVMGLLFLVFIVLAAFIPYMVSRSFYLFKRITPVASGILAQWRVLLESNVYVQRAFSELSGMLGASMSGITGRIAKAGMTAAAQLGRIAFSLVLTYYVLCERKRIGRHLLLFVPLAWRNAILVGICVSRNAVMCYFSGLIKTSFFVSGMTCAGLLLLDVQDALLLSMLMGIFEIFPYVGPILAAIPILLSAMMQGTKTTMLTLAILILVQQIEGNVIGPYFTASSTSIHPLAAIVGVFVFGSLMGFWGILIAVPILVLCQSLGQSWRQAKYAMNECSA